MPVHHALRIEEILFNIFGCCYPIHPGPPPSRTIERTRSTTDLAALARTCRAFKEPALDILWSELIDLSPLAFCLPNGHRTSSGRHLFTRPRNDAEWGTLRGYTRRVRRIISFSSLNGCLDPSSISATFDPPLLDPLFPNLRYLIWQGGVATLPVINFAAPLLASLDIRGAPREDISLYTNLLDTLVPRCPNIRNVRVQVANGTDFGKTVSRHLYHWQKLRVLDFLDLALPVDAILHLSRIPTLMWLSFLLDPLSFDPIPDPNAPLVFSRLVYLEIVSTSLEPITTLMTHVRLPAVQVLIVPFPSRPSKATVQTYLTTVSRVCTPSAMMDLRLLNVRRSFTPHVSSFARHMSHGCKLTLDDMLPCMAFSNLRSLHINVEWSVDLTDNDLLQLVITWPKMEHLIINDQWGWRTTNGITLDGLFRILKKCSLLQELCIAIDTQSATQVSDGWATDFTLPSPFWMNVVDSPIQPESVAALAAAFSALGFSSTHLIAWSGSEMRDIPGADAFRSRWTGLFH